MNNLSVVLATFNEENNLEKCLSSVADIASEIIIVDGGSVDRTIEIAKKFKAEVIQTENYPIFHINKQKALALARSRWILQLDADEIVTCELAREVVKIVGMSNGEIDEYQKSIKNRDLFLRHQQIITERDGNVGTPDDNYSAFFMPRLNYFLGDFLRHGGVYPDGVIRLVKKGKAYFPCKSVHEQIVVEGKVGWLQNNLIHMADPTFTRYLKRNSRYIDLIVDELKRNKVKKSLFNLISYCAVKPTGWFFLTFIAHKGFLDGFRGVIFSFFSALRFPRAYFRYLMSE